MLDIEIQVLKKHDTLTRHFTKYQFKSTKSICYNFDARKHTDIKSYYMKFTLLYTTCSINWFVQYLCKFVQLHRICLIQFLWFFFWYAIIPCIPITFFFFTTFKNIIYKISLWFINNLLSCVERIPDSC